MQSQNPSRTQNGQNNFSKEKVGGLSLPDFKIYYTVTVIKTVWYQYQDKQIDQWKKIAWKKTCTYIDN